MSSFSEKQYFFFGSLFDYCSVMLNDLHQLQCCHIRNDRQLIRNKLIWYLYKVHNSRIANTLFGLPFKSIWYNYLFDNKHVAKVVCEGGGNRFVFFDSNPLVYDSKFLNWCRYEVPSVKLVLIFVNSFANRTMVDAGYFRSNFDMIFTTDIKDAKEKGFEYLEGIHSKIHIETSFPQSDVVYFGANKKRETILLEIFRRLKDFGLQLDFTITGLSKPVVGVSESAIPYLDVLKREFNSRCLLDINNEGQNNYTQRVLEAIMYNKFLITNNPNVVYLKYFNPETMLVIKSAGDIDKSFIDRIKNKHYKVNYMYQGDFSPVNLLSIIE